VQHEYGSRSKQIIWNEELKKDKEPFRSSLHGNQLLFAVLIKKNVLYKVAEREADPL